MTASGEFRIFEAAERTRVLGKVPMLLAASVIPVMWRRPGGEIKGLGTAWPLIPDEGVFVSALHLFSAGEPVFDTHGTPFGGSSIADPDIFLLFPSPNGPTDKVGVSIRSISFGQPGDLCMLGIDMDEVPDVAAEHIVQFPISTHRPVPGQEFLCLGYPGTTVSQSGEGTVSADITFRASRGDVSEVFPHRQDRVMGPFPGFHFSALIPGGMSGGPVIAPTGVIGIASSGFDVAEGEEDCAIGASIAPLLQLPAPDGSQMTPLDPGKLSIVGPSISVVTGPDGEGMEVVWTD